jgi:TonB family protein
MTKQRRHFLVDDELSNSGKANGAGRWVKRLLVGLGLLGIVGVVGAAIFGMMGEGKSTRRQVVNITLMKPPPPPPPEPEQKPPEPEVAQEKVPDPETPEQVEEAPANDQLGLDAEGSGSGDGFGLAAKKGGKEITELGGPVTVNRAQFAWFTGLVQSHLQEHFHKNDKLRASDYRVVVRVWFAPDGRVDRYELVGSSGSSDVDKSLQLALDAMPRLQQAPPEDMPQPVKLRVTSRGAG